MWIAKFLLCITIKGMLVHSAMSRDRNNEAPPVLMNSIEEAASSSRGEGSPELEWCLLEMAGNVSIVKYRTRDFVNSLRLNVANLTQSTYEHVIFNGVTFSPEILVNMSLDWRFSHHTSNVMNQLAINNSTLFIISEEHFILLSFSQSSTILTGKPSPPGFNYRKAEVYIYISVVVLVALVICSGILFLCCYQFIQKKRVEKSTEDLMKTFNQIKSEDSKISSRYCDPPQLIYSKEFLKKLKQSDGYTPLHHNPFLVKEDRDFIPLDDNLFPMRGDVDYVPRYIQEEDHNSFYSSKNVSDVAPLEFTTNHLYTFTELDNHCHSDAALDPSKQETNPEDIYKVERRATSPYRKLSEKSCSPVEPDTYSPSSSPSPASNVHQSTTSRFTDECNFLVSPSPSPDPFQWSPYRLSSRSTYRGHSPYGDQSSFSGSPYRGKSPSFKSQHGDKSLHRDLSPTFKSPYKDLPSSTKSKHRRKSSNSLRSLGRSRSRPQSSSGTLRYLSSPGCHLSVPSPLHCSSYLLSQPASRPTSVPLDFDRQLLKPSREKIHQDVQQIFTDMGINQIIV